VHAEEEEEEDQNSTIKTKIPERSLEQIAAGKIELEKIKYQLLRTVTKKRSLLTNYISLTNH